MLRVATLAFVAAAITIAVHQSRRDDDENHDVPLAEFLVDPHAIELNRCRSITLQQNATDDSCRRAWAESRRRFFAPPSSRSNSGINDPSATVTGKSQDRVPTADVVPDRDGVR